MEIRARYTLMGLFVLAVLGAGFGFVYWLNTTAGFATRAYYLVRYDSPVSGLLKGSAVLFNGIRVGEVTALRLEPQAPSDVVVEIAIDQTAPVRADTRVGIEFQGLTGAPVVSLAGGTPSLPLLAAKGTATPPVLVAEKNAGLGMTQAARDLLRHLDTVVSDNAEPLRSLIANIDAFAGALARNADRVDGIVAGLERFTGGGTKPPVRTFDLAPATAFPGLTQTPAAQLQVQEPSALALFDTEKIVARRAEGGEAPSIGNAQWPDTLPKLVQARVLQSLENAGYMRALGRAPDGTRSDFQLILEIRSFQVTVGAAVSADVELAARLVNGEGGLVKAQVFKAAKPVAALGAEEAAKALSEAFQTVASGLVVWVCGTI